MIKKVAAKDIPAGSISDLEALLPRRYKDFIVVGENYYELYPTQSMKLLEICTTVLDMIELARAVKVTTLKSNGYSNEEIKGISMGIQDIFTIEDNQLKMKEVLKTILSGVDTEDFDTMTIAQMVDVLSKLLKVNLESFPKSFKDKFFSAVSSATNLSSESTLNAVSDEEDSKNV